jgi:hypothetical protein
MPCDLCETRCYILTNYGREPCPDCNSNGYQLTIEETAEEPDGYFYPETEPFETAPDLRLDGGNLYPYTWPDLRYIAANDDRFFADIA